MKAIRVEQQGGPEELKLLNIAPVGAPGPGQAVVRVVAAGVNFVDASGAALMPARCLSLRAWKARAWLNPLAKVSGA
jgi:NADPH:quinone reductase-like Zn-dependent oxidoreductase